VFLPDFVFFLAPVMVFLGMRHAVDVDHVTAIDNLVRIQGATKRSRLVGTFFSAGHMSAVLAEMVAIIFLVGTIAGSGGPTNAAVVNDLRLYGGIVGAIALSLIGGINLYSMKKWGKTGSAILATKIHERTKLFGAFGSAFITGFIFGMGFDTATQISALTLSAVASATTGIQIALVLFGFFAAGMIPTDTLDSFVLREGFSRILGTSVFRYLSYGLSGIALLVAFTESYGVLLNTEVLPPFTGAGLAVGLIASTFAYAYLRGRQQPQTRELTAEHFH
jgi:nickel/cobalt transporter (NiCoT) family protein